MLINDKWLNHAGLRAVDRQQYIYYQPLFMVSKSTGLRLEVVKACFPGHGVGGLNRLLPRISKRSQELRLNF